MAKYFGGSYLKERYIDLLEPNHQKKQDVRSGSEIFDEFLAKTGLVVVS